MVMSIKRKFKKSCDTCASAKDYQRRVALGRSGTISKEDLQHAQEAVQLAQAALDISIQQYNANRALLRNTELKNNLQFSKQLIAYAVRG